MLNDIELVTFLEKALKKAQESDRWHLSTLFVEICTEAKRLPGNTSFSPTVAYLEKAVEVAAQRDFAVWRLNGNPNGGMNYPEAIRVALELSVAWTKMTMLKEKLDGLFAKHHAASEAAFTKVSQRE